MTSKVAPEFRGTFGHFTNRWRPCAAIGVFALASLAAGAYAVAAAELEAWTGGAKPALILDRLDGPRTDLETLRGQVVLVHFFATWCEPCIAETAALNRLSERHSGKPLTILAVDVGEIDARVRTFARENEVAFPILLDRDKSAMKAWQVEGLPTSFVLDADHVPVFAAGGDVAWDDPQIDARLNSLIAQTGTRDAPAASN